MAVAAPVAVAVVGLAFALVFTLELGLALTNELTLLLPALFALTTVAIDVGGRLTGAVVVLTEPTTAAALADGGGGGGVLLGPGVVVTGVVATVVLIVFTFVPVLIDAVVMVPIFEIFKLALFKRNSPLFRNVIIFALAKAPLCCCVWMRWKICCWIFFV